MMREPASRNKEKKTETLESEMFKREETKKKSKDESEAVFEGGPYHVGGTWLVLKKWHNMLKLSRDQMDRVPIWVKLYNVPLEYWDEDGLSRISSAIGVPLFMDRLTAQARRISFARVCVEVEAKAPKPHNIPIRCGDETLVVRVEYQWMPMMCAKCLTFGHREDKCERVVGGGVDKTVVGPVEKMASTDEAEVEDEGWEEVKRKGKRKVVYEGEEGEKGDDIRGGGTNSAEVSFGMANVEAAPELQKCVETTTVEAEAGTGVELIPDPAVVLITDEVVNVGSNILLPITAGDDKEDREASRSQEQEQQPATVGGSKINVKNQRSGNKGSNKGGGSHRGGKRR